MVAVPKLEDYRMHLACVDRDRSRSRLAGIPFSPAVRTAAPTGREWRATFLSTKYTWRSAVLASVSFLLLATTAPAQTDPGPRGGTAGAGGAIVAHRAHTLPRPRALSGRRRRAARTGPAIQL